MLSRLVIPKALRDSAVYALGTVSSRLVGVLLLPVLTRYLSPADYGVLELLGIAANFSALVFGARMLDGIFKFYFETDSESDRAQLVSTMLATVLAFFGAGALVLALFSGRISEFLLGSSEFSGLLVIYLGSIVLSVFTHIPLAYARCQQKPWQFLAIGQGLLIVQCVLIVTFVVVLGYGIAGMAYGLFLAHCVVGSVSIVWLFRKIGFQFSRSYFRRIVSFGWPLVFGSLAMYFAVSGDRIFLGQLASIAEVGIYAVAYKFGNGIVSLAWAPIQLMWSAKQFELVKTEAGLLQIRRYFFWITACIMFVTLTVSMFSDEILRIFATEDFFAAANVIPFIAAAYMVKCLSAFGSLSLQETGRTHWIMAADWLSAVVAAVAFMTLIPRFGAIGAALGILCAFSSHAITVNVIGNFVRPLNLPWGRFFLAALLSIAVFAASETPLINPVAMVFVKLGLLVTWVASVFLTFESFRTQFGFLLGRLRRS